MNKVNKAGNIIVPYITALQARFKAGDKFKIDFRDGTILISKIEKMEKEKKI